MYFKAIFGILKGSFGYEELKIGYKWVQITCGQSYIKLYHFHNEKRLYYMTAFLTRLKDIWAPKGL